VTVWLGLRLAVAGGRESLLRLAVMALGVGVSVLLPRPIPRSSSP